MLYCFPTKKSFQKIASACGTALFISAQPAATGADQKKAIRESFRLASQQLPLGRTVRLDAKPRTGALETQWPGWKLLTGVE